ncbi:hypothetical protein PF008_g33305 [Phytophthora fragariae]|uniref:Uncharacterized protein n=1 Tax=Phytophthora fragariae TaxID=53985 RepID=A0A6G0PXD5_9STRA|nr:hypothetical protein PF008_g33305 [Phytophthora fragariae]
MWARRLRWRLRRRRVRQGEPRRCRKDPKTPKLLELHPAGRQACCPAEVGWRKPSGTTSGTAAPIPQGCLVKIADTRIAYGVNTPSPPLTVSFVESYRDRQPSSHKRSFVLDHA